MINPFVSIDEQLHRHGWNKYYENGNGFRFVKMMGVDVRFLADFNKYGIKFYDDPYLFRSIDVNEVTLKLFAAKIKEWRRQNERNSKAGRHYRKKRS